MARLNADNRKALNALKNGPLSPTQLKSATGFSDPKLGRTIRSLQAFRYITISDGELRITEAGRRALG